MILSLNLLRTTTVSNSIYSCLGSFGRRYPPVNSDRICKKNTFYQYCNRRAFWTISNHQISTKAPESAMTAKPGKGDLAPPRPSSSVVLISPQNEVLLLHRVKTSTSFASAHVFPGGNISPLQDGESEFKDPKDPRRHYDAPDYRNAAIRELFEESGILLAKESNRSSELIRMDEADRERGRQDIHSNKITFFEWLRRHHTTAEPDTDGLIPFTHWITPSNVPRRFTTQMYLYFLPIPDSPNASSEGTTSQGLPQGGRQEVQVPTSDGGIEINEARFLPASKWLEKAHAGEIILYPPQFLLLSIVSEFLDKPGSSPSHGSQNEEEAAQERQQRRNDLLAWVHTGIPPWTDKFVSPRVVKLLDDQRVILDLDDPGPELHGSGKKGVLDRVIVANFSKDGPRNLDVFWKKDILGDSKSSKSSL